MTFEQFTQSLSLDTLPAELPVLLQALWYDGKGDWEAAHNIAQSREGTRGYDRLHAYLHRVEGDEWNAGYWYRRAGAKVFRGSLKEEWTELVHELLAGKEL
ncbi:hypothetical protein DSL64_07230 [Dyadobacter luteus]|uniref:Uncharacterized protein n=1 Tax=Dyadobacter luteus TaxID=2259619 RepID=A0A3D8YEL0_9BACT|nr:hypothetical protein [Dyadobacter luteus]REA62708.1 hypothetical protein DSL64_07230 [Dyadobacter luteus]